MSRKVMFYIAAALIGVAGIVLSQVVMTSAKPSVVLAATYPAMLLGTGLLAGICLYLGTPAVPLPKPSNDHKPERSDRPERVRVRKRVRLSNR